MSKQQDNKPKDKENEKQQDKDKEKDKNNDKEEDKEDEERDSSRRRNSNRRSSVSITNNDSEYDENRSAAAISVADTLKNIKIQIPIPSKAKIIINIVLIIAGVLGLMIFVVLFGNEDMTGGAVSSGSRAYGQTCTKITVTDTENHIYDGEVEFEDYIAGVVAAESEGINNIEYYKLLAIMARTYTFENIDNSCIVEGNENFQEYMDINDSSNSSLIKQAVEETESFVIVEDDDLADITYGYGNIVSEDDTYYYISYGSNTLDEEETQQIPKAWADSQPITKPTENTNDYDISLIGALYLITNENYNYQSTINHYCGSDYEVTENAIILAGVDGFMNPTRYIYCSSPFGYRIHPVHKVENFHSGLDIGIPGGEPIFAAKDGKVTIARTDVNAINNCDYGYGNYILIDHGDGSSTLYSHIKYGSIPDSIYVGAEISQGEQIGEIGSTGCSTGNHLHYEVRINNEPVDPADYLDLTGASGTCRR